MKLAFTIAKRFLTYSKGQSILIMLGIAIGVSVQIFIGLLISGLQDDLINTTVGSSPHITILANTEDDTFSYTSEIESTLEAIEEVTYLGIFADRPAFVVQDDKNASILVRGFAKDAANIYSVERRLIDGRLPNASNEI